MPGILAEFRREADAVEMGSVVHRHVLHEIPDIPNQHVVQQVRPGGAFVERPLPQMEPALQFNPSGLVDAGLSPELDLHGGLGPHERENQLNHCR